MGILAVGVTVSFVGPGSREDRYSCHLCRGLKEIQSSRFFKWTFRQQAVVSEPATVGAAHQHEWWRYSYSYKDGLFGCLGSGVACKTDGRFKNEQGAKSMASAITTKRTHVHHELESAEMTEDHRGRRLALIDAAGLGQVDKVDALLADDPTAINSRSSIGETPLHFLAVEDYVKGVRLLLERGADVNTRNHFEGTRLHDAAALGYTEMVQLLLAFGADVAARDNIEFTPLHWAADKENLQILDALLEGGADPNADDGLENTPISMATNKASVELLRKFAKRHQK